jgi:hypothetical protein
MTMYQLTPGVATSYTNGVPKKLFDVLGRSGMSRRLQYTVTWQGERSVVLELRPSVVGEAKMGYTSQQNNICIAVRQAMAKTYGNRIANVDWNDLVIVAEPVQARASIHLGRRRS